MTNAEKYEEVFGFEPAVHMCPTQHCDNCPIHSLGIMCSDTEEWWCEEYKGDGTE